MIEPSETEESSECIVPQVNAEAEFNEILNDFGNPLEILREAISNSYDAQASEIAISFEVKEIDGSKKLVIQLNDDGCGISEESLRRDFWGLGHSTSRGDKTKIGEKGHGTKIYLRSEHVIVKTQTATGAWLSECINPLRALTQQKLHTPTIQSISTFRDSPGTEITVIGYNGNERSTFIQDVVKDYINWFTKAGTIETSIGTDAIHSIRVKLKCLDRDEYEELKFGHEFPEENSDIHKLFKEYETEAADWYVKRWVHRGRRLTSFPEVVYDVIVSIEGDKVKRKYNPMIRDRRRSDSGRYKVSDRYGVWLCKDFMPIVRVNDWISGFGSGSNAITLLHAFVNCQSLRLTANRGTVSNTDPQILEELKKAIQEVVDDVDRHIQKEGIYTLREWQEEHRTIQQEQDEYERRVNSIRERRSAIFMGQRLLEPRNESELFGLLMKLQTLKPELFEFEPLDYNTSKGVDVIARNRSSEGLMKGELWYVELKHILRKEFNHAFRHIRWIVCWDFEKSVTSGSKFHGVEDADVRTLEIASEDDGRHLYFLDGKKRQIKIQVIRLKQYLEEVENLKFDIVPADEA